MPSLATENTNSVEAKVSPPNGLRRTALTALAGIAAFHIAYAIPPLAFCLMLVYAWSLCELTAAKTDQRAFYTGLGMGLCVFVPQLLFFWTLFKAVAIPLWVVLAVFHGLFVLLGKFARDKFGLRGAALLFPFLWLGLEYFRSELYYLKFSWINIGYAFADVFGPVLRFGGVYGAGFLCFAAGAFLAFMRPKLNRATFLIAVLVAILLPGGFVESLRGGKILPPGTPGTVYISGIQTEFPVELEVPELLDKLLKAHPASKIVVLSEYTFDGDIPKRVRDWCRNNGRWLVAGGRHRLEGKTYRNTVFVVNPSGKTEFEQAKSIPIQFFDDGLPAAEQHLWESPWGKIGICICYDLSYTRVVDRLIQMGAQALIVPTMDVVEWGEGQHALHARVAPVRAAEYGVPIFRLASSGISQLVDARGRVQQSAPFPGPEAMLGGQLVMAKSPHRPLDRFLAWPAVALTAALLLYYLITRFKPKPAKSNPGPP